MRAIFSNSTAVRPDGRLYARARFDLELVSNTAVRSGSAHPKRPIMRIFTDVNGRFPSNLVIETPETGAWRWRLRWPDNQVVEALIEQGDGSPIEIDDFIALAELQGSDPALPQFETLLALHGGLQSATPGQKFTPAPGGGWQWVDGEIPEPPADGDYVRRVEEGVGSWAQAITLSDYATVIVVDTAGNGDYTSLRQAIIDAPSGSAIFVFGEVNDPGERLFFDKRLAIIGTGQTISLVMGPSNTQLLEVFNCTLPAYCGHGINSVNIALHNVKDALLETLGGSVVLRDCSGVRYSDYASAALTAYSTHFTSIYVEDNYWPTVKLVGCTIDAFTLHSYDGVGINSASYLVGCRISNVTVAGNHSWANAPFYGCSFVSQPVGMSVQAGNYSNTVGNSSWPALAFDPAGSATAVQSNLDTHTGDASIHYPDAAADGLWARLRSSGVGSWLAATSVGAALFAAVDAAAARGAIGAMPVVSPAVAGNLVTLVTGGTVADAGYAADADGTVAGSVVRRGSSGEIRIENQNNTFGDNSTAIVAVAGVDGVAVQGSGNIAIEGNGSMIGLKGVSGNSAASFGSETGFPPAYAEQSNIAGEDGVLRFTGANAAINRTAMRNEINAAALGANTFTGNQTLGGHEIRQYREQEVTATAVATYTINGDSGNLFIITSTGNTVFSAENMDRRSVTVHLRQDDVGLRDRSFSGVRWAGGTPPALSTAANAEDVIVLWGAGGNIYGSLAGKGFAT